MNIFIGTPQDISSVSAGLSASLADTLKKFYGEFPQQDIKYYLHDEPFVDIYVMEQARFNNYNKVIKDSIEAIVQHFVNNADVRVNLDYSAIDPKFDPLSSLKSGIVEEAKKNLMNNQDKSPRKSDEFDYDRLSENYQAEEPRYSFDQVILPDSVAERINEAIGTIQVEHRVFDEWGLRSIIPNASSAISFYGPPGTGKSMAAEAVASKLGKKILRATYADIESKYHGEGPKMVKAIFRAAERDDAVLFLDESDSLLSKRLTNVSDGTGQAINSMRSQLLICLEQFKGIVIFATNLVVNYDRAFLSRLINIEFPIPDQKARKLIWERHLIGEGLHIPLSSDVNIDELAEKYNFCGREIKNSVKNACVSVALGGKEHVSQADLLNSAEDVKTEAEKVSKADDHTKVVKLSQEQNSVLKDALQEKLDHCNNGSSQNK